MNKKPFFSVIVPEHNSAEYMRKGLESIRGQAFADYELIIICDKCNTKAEMEIACEYADVLIETNYGKAGLARNAGLNVARGEWILFMDDDDWYLPGAFSRIAGVIEKNTEIDIVAYGFEWRHRGVALQSIGRKYPAVWTKAWRRDFIGEKRFPVWIHTEDVDFCKRVLPGAWYAFIPEPLYYYNFMRAGSLSERIRDGEFNNDDIPEESCRDAAVKYERWLKEKY